MEKNKTKGTPKSGVPRKYVSNGTFVFDEKIHAEKNSGISETIQGESYTINQLIEKSKGGLVVPLNQYDQYGSDDIEDTQFRPQDLTEITEAKEQKQNIDKIIESAKASSKTEEAKNKKVETDKESVERVNGDEGTNGKANSDE